jgi:RND family efflux transporter MFP subunit
MQTRLRTHVVILGVLAVVATAACESPEAGAPEAEAVRTIPVRTAAVQTRDLTEMLSLTGTLHPRAEVIVASELSARLVRVLRQEGDRVSRGQLLAVLDEADFRLTRDRAKAMVDVAEANRAHARAEKERADSLLKTGGITDKDHLAAQLALQVAEASRAQARSELAITERQLGRARIIAPISGRIAKRHADAGVMLAAGTPLYTIVDDAIYEFRASVASADLRKLKVGGAATVTVDALPGLTVEGAVSRIAPQVDARSRAFEAIIHVPGRDELVSGLFARAEVKVREVPESLVVPPGALVRDGGDPTRAISYAVVNGRAERRDVTVGVETADAVQVTTGLKGGEIVVIDPPSALGPGVQVAVQRDGRAGS